ncbi:peptidase [Alicyclobacillus cellulosilyticus]|uniref:Peptidase n=1 Tax=Alicyclobacillus cellulosilyticus TaxID=1003997 RepID=A0A917K0C4_9BACL|nr:site-2 protease family protein [Alicyclobacillus cellulosilyticus]GGI95556.1 peptidase [Alicyclobacillus cellulosilyticus]
MLDFFGPDFLFRIIAVVTGLVVHEFAHAVVADWLGDRTPRLAGRLTLNPLVHFDPIGLLLMLFAPIGWAKPVPIQPANFHWPRYGLVITALAGPMSNLLLAVASIAALDAAHLRDPYGFWFMLLNGMFMVNVNLCVFNLIPVPPLDGARILAGFLPRRWAMVYHQWEVYGPFVLLLAVMVPQVRYAVFGTLFLAAQSWIGSWFGWFGLHLG